MNAPDIPHDLSPVVSALSRLHNDGRDQPHQYLVYRLAEPSYYATAADQRAEPDWAAETAAYLGRMLINREGRRSLEIAELDLARLTPETAWLLKHLIANRPAPLRPDLARYERLLTVAPNLRPLAALTCAEVTLPIITTTRPLRCYPYLDSHGIII